MPSFAMRRPFAWAILAVLIPLLAACGTQSGDPDPRSVSPDAPGVLSMTLDGIERAGVTVTADDGSVAFDAAVDGSEEIELAAGEYTVDGRPHAAAVDPSAVRVSIEAGGRTEITLRYEAVAEPPSAPVATLMIEAVTDGATAPLPYRTERNANKDVDIYASQTEEAVCVTVVATDAGGDPVRNAQLKVSVAETFGLSSDTVAIVRGCALEPGAAGLVANAVSDAIYTDDEGRATFTLYSTGNIAEELVGFAKVVVSASNPDTTAVLTEFKIAFWNISHLWVAFHDEDPMSTDRRVGASYERSNLFDSNDRRVNGIDRNAFPIATSLYTKQPQFALDLGAVGFIRYRVVDELDRNGDPADVVHLEGCDSPPTVDGDGYETCDDLDGIVHLVPNDGTTLEDMPIQATVEAVLHVELEYGAVYRFPLKDYRVTKRWLGSYLRIRKSVDHHVLTWAGNETNEYTLDPANAVAAGSPYTATFTIEVANEGTDTVYDISIGDLLPAELGVIESTVDPSGGTYDSVQHALTWNWRQNEAQLPEFARLEPGEGFQVSFQVYVRQKPGFCVDVEDYLASEFYANRWTWASDFDDTPCYTDPFEIINGAELHDVTASWFSSAPSDAGGVQAVTDFNGWVYEDDVIIHAVRPLFDLDKVLANPLDLPFEVGLDAFFDITLVNIARDEVEPAYAALAGLYPGEFDGTIRDNPIGYHIEIADLFLLGLDFTDATPMILSDDEGVRADQSYDATFVGAPPAPFVDLGDKAVVWDVIPYMGGGDVARARLILDHDLPGYHVNLAAMVGYNLNQFDLGDCLEPVDGLAPPPVPALPSILVDCAFTFALEPTDPWLELDSLGTNEVLTLSGNQSVTFHDTVVRGDTFPWVFSVLNGGNAAAERATIDVTLDDTDKAAITDAFLAVFDDLGALVATLPPTAISAGAASFGPYDHPPGWTAYAVVFADAKKVGNVTATATVDYDADSTDTQQPLLPLSMNEIVSIQPPR